MLTTHKVSRTARRSFLLLFLLRSNAFGYLGGPHICGIFRPASHQLPGPIQRAALCSIQLLVLFYVLLALRANCFSLLSWVSLPTVAPPLPVFLGAKCFFQKNKICNKSLTLRRPQAQYQTPTTRKRQENLYCLTKYAGPAKVDRRKLRIRSLCERQQLYPVGHARISHCCMLFMSLCVNLVTHALCNNSVWEYRTFIQQVRRWDRR